MKKLTLIILLTFLFPLSLYADPQSGRQLWTEADGNPTPEPCWQMTVTNGTLGNTGGACTLTTGGGAGGAPTDADYLVGTANGSLSAEIVVGLTPGGELGGTWASPTVDSGIHDDEYLKLDQTAAQTVINGLPIFDNGIITDLLKGQTDSDVTIDLSPAEDTIHLHPGNSAGDYYVVLYSASDDANYPQIYPNTNASGRLGLTTNKWAQIHAVAGTFDGFTLGADEYLTLGASTFGYSSLYQDFIANNDIIIKDQSSPSTWLIATDWNNGFGFHYHPGTNYPFGLFYGTDTGSAINLGNGGFPIWYVDSSLNFKFPNNNVTIAKDLAHEFPRSTGIEDLAAADDDKPFGSFPNNVTITKLGCHCIGTCTTPATITLEDGGGNAMTGTATCVASGTDITFTSLTAGNTLNAGELLRFDVTNTPNPATDDYDITIGYTE